MNDTVRNKRKLVGVVTSDRMDKTRVVSIARLKKHPKYRQYYRVTTTLKAHDEKNEYRKGDEVVIEETRPRSKEKRWAIVELVKRADRAGTAENEPQSP